MKNTYPDLPGSIQSRRHDIPSNEELEICLAAMSSGKAAGHDSIPSELYKRIPTCKKELFALVRAIWAEEHVPPDGDGHVCDVVQKQRLEKRLYQVPYDLPFANHVQNGFNSSLASTQTRM